MKFCSNLTAGFVAGVFLYLFSTYSEEALSMVLSNFEHFPLAESLLRDNQGVNISVYKDFSLGRNVFSQRHYWTKTASCIYCNSKFSWNSKVLLNKKQTGTFSTVRIYKNRP